MQQFISVVETTFFAEHLEKEAHNTLALVYNIVNNFLIK